MGTPVSDRMIMLYILFYTYFGGEAYALSLLTVIAPPLISKTAASTTAPVVSALALVIRLPFLIRDNVV